VCVCVCVCVCVFVYVFLAVFTAGSMHTATDHAQHPGGNVTLVARATWYVKSASCRCVYRQIKAGRGDFFVRFCGACARASTQTHASTRKHTHLHMYTRSAMQFDAARTCLHEGGRVFRTATGAMQDRSIAMCRSHPGPSIPSATHALRQRRGQRLCTKCAGALARCL
jgi:hypothetical protein